MFNSFKVHFSQSLLSDDDLLVMIFNIYSIKLDFSLKISNVLSDAIQAITLPSGSLLNNNFVGTSAQVSGYGRTGDGMFFKNFNVTFINELVFEELTINSRKYSIYIALMVFRFSTQHPTRSSEESGNRPSYYQQ